MEHAIATHTTKPAWLPVLAALSPGVILVLLIALPYTGSATTHFIAKNWGNVASLWGLGVSFYVLFVARGARRAAEDARSAEKLRTAIVGIEDAAAKCTQIGQFAGVQKWDVVELRAQEVWTCCRTTLARWGETEALTESRRKLSEVATLMRSIVEESRSPNVNGKTILQAQLDSHEKLSVVLGKIQKEHKSGSL